MAPKKRHVLVGSGVILLFLFAFRERNTIAQDLGHLRSSGPFHFSPAHTSTESGVQGPSVPSSLSLPAEYSAAALLNLSEPLSEFCTERFGTRFLLFADPDHSNGANHDVHTFPSLPSTQPSRAVERAGTSADDGKVC